MPLLKSIKKKTRLLVVVFLASTVALGTDCGSKRDAQRYPVKDEGMWDPNVPLIVLWPEVDSGLPEAQHIPENNSLLDGFSLTDSSGSAVPFSVTPTEGGVLLCVDGGLEQEMEYTWKVGPFVDSPHQIPVPAFSLEGNWSFRTAAVSYVSAPGKHCELPSSICIPNDYSDGLECLDTGEAN